MALFNGGNTITTATELLGNSLGATGGQLTVVSNTAQVNIGAAGANTQNGNVFTIHVAGVTPPINFGSEAIVPPITLAILVGANGNTADQTVASAVIPAGPGGVWAADVFLTVRKNATFSGGSNANSSWVCVITDISNPVPYSSIPEVVMSGSAATNGAINVSTQTAAGAYTSNLANISIAVALNTTQNGNTFVESMVLRSL